MFAGSAYYRYLHKAMEIKHSNLERGRNASVLSSCYGAIHDENVVALYESANIHFAHLDVDLAELERESNVEWNRKHHLIAMCQVEIESMMAVIRRDQTKRDRVEQREIQSIIASEAYALFLQQSFFTLNANPGMSIMSVCRRGIE